MYDSTTIFKKTAALINRDIFVNSETYTSKSLSE